LSTVPRAVLEVREVERDALFGQLVPGLVPASMKGSAEKRSEDAPSPLNARQFGASMKGSAEKRSERRSMRSSRWVARPR